MQREACQKAKAVMIDFILVQEIALKLPDVTATESSRGPGLKAHGKLMACPATHKSAESDTLMVRVSKDERESRIAGDPREYYVTDHYRDYPALLVRLSEIDRESLEDLLGCSWRFVHEQAASG
jgi:hypothetical protein